MKAWILMLSLASAGCSFLFNSSSSTSPEATEGAAAPAYSPPPVTSTHGMFQTGFRSYTTFNLSESLDVPTRPAICKLPGGSVVAVWQEGPDKMPMLLSSVMGKDDALPSDPVKIHELGALIDGLTCVGTRKGAVVLWREQGGDIAYQRLSMGGSASGTPGKVSDMKSLPGDFDAVSVGSDVYVAFVDGDLIAISHINAKGKVKIKKPIQSGGGAKLVQIVQEKKGGFIYVFWATDLAGFQHESVHYAGLSLKLKLKNGPFTISPMKGKIVELDVMADPMIDDNEHRFIASMEFSTQTGRASWKYYFYSGQLSESPVDNGATTTLMQYMDAEGEISGECFAVASGQISGAGPGFKCWVDNWPGDFHLDLHMTTGLTDLDPGGFSSVLADGTLYVAYVAQDQGAKDVYLTRAFDQDLIDPPPPPPPPPPPTYSQPSYSSPSYSSPSSPPAPPPEGVQPDCTCNGIKLYGKVEVKDAFADFKVEVVDAFADIKVRKVDAFADSCGEWEIVDAFGDFTVEWVDAFGDFKVEFVDAFPGL